MSTLCFFYATCKDNHIYALHNNRKADDKDIADKVARDTRIDLKLEEITNYVKEIRDDNTELKRQFSEMNRQLVIVEQSVKSAHHRIDRMEGKEDNNNA